MAERATRHGSRPGGDPLADDPAGGLEPTPELRRLPVELIAPNPRQPRQSFDEESLLGLAESVRERGVLQPVLVRPLPGGRTS